MKNETNSYDFGIHIAEVYDMTETQTEDVDLLRRLTSDLGPLRILEPFCGTGRILIPLAEDGHRIVGLDQAGSMLDLTGQKVADLPGDVRERIELRRDDVTTSLWPDAFDLVILGANCFYELPTPDEQEYCVRSAARALKPGGFVYIDNDHMEGDLEDAWCELDKKTPQFPNGTCADGIVVKGYSVTTWCDPPNRLVRFQRKIEVTFPDGRTESHEWTQQKHPVSTGEVKGWLEKHGFVIEKHFGERSGKPYTEGSPRSIFWAKKT